jgi:hypothetical protein
LRRPADWIPSSEFDLPEWAEVVETVNHPLSDPLTFVRQYNAISLDEHGVTWAALAATGARPGTMLALTAPSRGKEPRGA